MPKITDQDIAEAKQLVATGRTNDARKLLQRFDDDRARAALKKFNQRYPVKMSEQSRQTQHLLFGGVFVAIALALLALSGVLISLKRQQDALQPLSDLFNVTPLPTWTLPYISPITAVEWVCYGYYESRGLSESALKQACSKEAELFYRENKAAVDECYTANPEHLDFLKCAIDQKFYFDGGYIEAVQ